MSTVSTYDALAKFIGNNDKRLISQVLNGLDFVPQVRVIRNASLNGTGLQKMTAAKGIRPLNLDVETRSGAHRSFTARKILVYTGMKIIKIVAEEAEKTWMSDMLEPGAKQIPFEQWVWENEMKKIAQEINDNIYLSDYKGDATAFDSGATYTGGAAWVTFGDDQDIYKCITTTTAGQSPTTHPAKWELVNQSVISTGWGKIIANEITAGNIAGANLISTGSITSSNCLDKVEAMIDGMTVAHRNLGGTVKMSPVTFAKYLKHERTVYTAALTPAMGAEQKTVYGYPKWKIEECTWMGSSSRLIVTQKENLAFGTNLETDMGKISKTIQTLHGSTSVVKWRQGCEIADLETLYVNDQA